MSKKPKVLFFDLETLPNPIAMYERLPSLGAWEGRTFKTELHTIINFGYKWEHEARPKIINGWDFKTQWKKDRFNDKFLLEAASKLILEADQVVTHNGKQFDWKAMQTRLAFHGLPALPKINHVDTKVVAKQKLSLYSNSLADVAKFFKLDDKMTFNNKWGLWVRIAYGKESKKDLKLMSDYCKMDVEVLHQVYNKLRPHHNGSVSAQLFEEGTVCPSCGGAHLIGNGQRMTTKGPVQRLRCSDCGTSVTVDAKGKAKRL